MFINNYCLISPLGLLTSEDHFFPTVKKNEESGQLNCLEPDYSKWLTALQLRRMSKTIRMSVAASLECLNNTKPNSIHVGTAYGVLHDTEIFLKNTIIQKEKMLSPTAFIQSTHNTVAGTIALSIGSNVHNMTFVHKAHSFENALLDGEILLQEHPENQILVGSAEELTENKFEILMNVDVYRENICPGEGAAFFLISAQQKKNSVAHLKGYHFFKHRHRGDVVEQIQNFISYQNVELPQEALIVLGSQISLPEQDIYNEVISTCFPHNETFLFKDLCGEYPTASSFGLSYCAHLLKEKKQHRCWMINNFGLFWSIWCLESVE